jgi:hypothetical protein
LPTIQIDLNDAIDADVGGSFNQDNMEDGNDNVSDDTEFDLHDDDEEDDEEMLIMEVREMAIALSHGLYPFHESKRLKRAMVEHGFKTGRQLGYPARRSENEKTADGGEVAIPLRDVWRMEKRIDWVIVESIMVVMFCNIRHAVVNHGWGRSFKLPNADRSVSGRDVEARKLYAHQGSGPYYQEWKDLLCLPCGWNLSRGDSRRVPPSTKETAGHDASGKEGASQDTLQEKPFDYAAVESTWIGTCVCMSVLRCALRC